MLLLIMQCLVTDTAHELMLLIFFISFAEIDCNVTTLPGVTLVACETSKDLFLPPACSLLMVGAGRQSAVDVPCECMKYTRDTLCYLS